MTWRVIKIEDGELEITTVIASGLVSMDLARQRIKNDVRNDINDEYNDEPFELRWMPESGMAMFRKLGEHRTVQWRTEQE